MLYLELNNLGHFVVVAAFSFYMLYKKIKHLASLENSLTSCDPGCMYGEFQIHVCRLVRAFQFRGFLELLLLQSFQCLFQVFLVVLDNFGPGLLDPQKGAGLFGFRS